MNRYEDAVLIGQIAGGFEVQPSSAAAGRGTAITPARVLAVTPGPSSNAARPAAARRHAPGSREERR